MPADQADHEVTRLLQAWGSGDSAALDALIPLVFNDLHRMAQSFFRREVTGHTLQPTALLSELYLRLHGKENTHWTERREFFGFAADLMRHILVDHARARKSKKRGGDLVRIPLDPSLNLALETDVDLVDLDTALNELAKVDERQAQVVELRYFVGLSVEETAEVLEIARATVKRDWRTAKFWLHRRLKTPQTDPEKSADAAW